MRLSVDINSINTILEGIVNDEELIEEDASLTIATSDKKNNNNSEKI